MFTLNAHLVVATGVQDLQVVGCTFVPTDGEPAPVLSFNLDGTSEEILDKLIDTGAAVLAAAELTEESKSEWTGRCQTLQDHFHKTKPERTAVYRLIDGEREYMDQLGPERTELAPGEKRRVGEYLTMLRHYLRIADASWTLVAGDEQALENIRKIAGIAVKCMEEHGAPAR